MRHRVYYIVLFCSILSEFTILTKAALIKFFFFPVSDINMDFFLTPGRDPTALFSETRYSIAAGFAVWGGATVILHPLDVWKIRSQQEAHNRLPRSSLSMLRVAAKEGLWRGWWQSAAFAIATRLSAPLLYEKVKIWCGPSGNKKFGLYCQGSSYKETRNLAFSLDIANYMNSFQAGLLIGPLEGLKDRVLSPLLIATQNKELYKGQIPVSQGRISSHLPIGAMMLRGGLFWCAFLGTYERMLFSLRNPRLKSPTFTDICLTSVVSSVAATIVTHPVDCVHQIHHSIKQSTQAEMLAIINRISSHSVTHFYRGIAPALVRNALLFGTTFPLYDMLRGSIGGRQFIEVW